VIVNVALIESLFAPDEYERWFGTTELRDDDGTTYDGTLISVEAAEEIYRRYYREKA
jgi:hypothetical protein